MSGPCRSSASAEAETERARNRPGLPFSPSQIAEAVRPDDLFRDAALRQPVERLGMIPDFGLGFGQQLRRVVLPPLRRPFLDGRLPCRPHLRFQRSGTAGRGAQACPRPVRHRASRKVLPSMSLMYRDAVAGPAAAPTREHAGDVVLGAGMAKVPFPVGPDYEAVGLADFTTTNRAWAIPAIPSGFHASTETVPIQFQHGAHSDLSVSVRCLFLLSTYFIYFLSEWTDGQICM